MNQYVCRFIAGLYLTNALTNLSRLQYISCH